MIVADGPHDRGALFVLARVALVPGVALAVAVGGLDPRLGPLELTLAAAPLPVALLAVVDGASDVVARPPRIGSDAVALACGCVACPSEALFRPGMALMEVCLIQDPIRHTIGAELSFPSLAVLLLTRGAKVVCVAAAAACCAVAASLPVADLAVRGRARGLAAVVPEPPQRALALPFGPLAHPVAAALDPVLKAEVVISGGALLILLALDGTRAHLVLAAPERAVVVGPDAAALAIHGGVALPEAGPPGADRGCLRAILFVEAHVALAAPLREIR